MEWPFAPRSECARLLQEPHLWSLWKLQQLLPGWPPNAQRTNQPVRVWLWQQLEGKIYTQWKKKRRQSKRDKVEFFMSQTTYSHFRSKTAATPSHPVVPVRMSTPVKMQATRPRRGLTLAARCWSRLPSSPATAWCLLNRGTEPACTTSAPAVPILTSVCVTRWRPTPASAEKLESSCSGGAHRCVVSAAQTERPQQHVFSFSVLAIRKV